VALSFSSEFIIPICSVVDESDDRDRGQKMYADTYIFWPLSLSSLSSIPKYYPEPAIHRGGFYNSNNRDFVHEGLGGG